MVHPAGAAASPLRLDGVSVPRAAGRGQPDRAHRARSSASPGSRAPGTRPSSSSSAAAGGPSAATVLLPGGRPVPRGLRGAIGAGVALVSGDRRRFGLMLDKPVWDNIGQVRAVALAADGPLVSARRLRAHARDTGRAPAGTHAVDRRARGRAVGRQPAEGRLREVARRAAVGPAARRPDPRRRRRRQGRDARPRPRRGGGGRGGPAHLDRPRRARRGLRPRPRLRPRRDRRRARGPSSSDRTTCSRR